MDERNISYQLENSKSEKDKRSLISSMFSLVSLLSKSIQILHVKDKVT